MPSQREAVRLASALLIVLVHVTEGDHVLEGEWVRYRPDFHDYAVGYNQHSTATLNGRPSALFFPSSTEQVQWFTRTFREEYAFSVRSGGHSFAGLSSTPCSLTIDTSNLQNVELVSNVDYTNRLARAKVGAGVRQGTLNNQLFRRDSGLGLPGANCKDVGVMGCTLGGCHGYLSATYGLTSDNVQSFEVVLADSRVVNVNASQHPDLFWALRGGGGGDFGVVTSMEVNARIVRGVVTYDIEFDISNEEQLVELLDIWQNWALADLAPGMSAYLKCSTSFACVARGAMTGRDDAPLRRSVGMLTSRFENEPAANIAAMELQAMQRMFEECGEEEELGHQVKSLYFDAAMPRKVLEFGAGVLPKGATLPGVAWSGLEVQRVGLYEQGSGAAGSAADSWHENQLLVRLQTSWAVWEDLESAEAARAEHLDWLRQLHVALAPTSTGAYRNFEDLDMGAAYFTHATWASHPASFYYPGDSVLQLERVKLEYDPEDVFRHPLSASFEATGMEEFRAECKSKEWPAAPERGIGDLPTEKVLVGVHAEYGADRIQEGQLADAATRMTHVIHSAVQPLDGGWVNVSRDEPAGLALRAFADTVRRANPKAKRLVSIGGPGAPYAVWQETVASWWRRSNVGKTVRILLDEFELDGVSLDWTPRGEHRHNFTDLVRHIRDHLGPGHELLVHADVSPEAVAQGYDVRELCNMSDYVLLRAYDFEFLEQGNTLEWLTHLGANLFSVNPTLPSAAGGVAAWLKAGAPRAKLVLGAATYGYGYDVDGAAPDSPGRLDWKVRGKTAALTEVSQIPGEAAWGELRQHLANEWSSWTTQEVPELGGAAAWSEELRVWVGYDSPATMAQKAGWVNLMGLAGGMVGPIHMDAVGADSLADAFRAGLRVEQFVAEEESGIDVMMITLVCVIPTILLGCCVDAQLRRWGDIRKMHDGLTHVSNTTESWNAKIHTSFTPFPASHARSAEGNGDADQSGHNGNQRLSSVVSSPDRGRSRKQSVAFFARRFSTASSVQPKSNNMARAGSGPTANPNSGMRSPSAASRRGSLAFLRTSSVLAVQSAFDGAMLKGVSSEFDEEVQWGAAETAVDKAALREMSDRELSRKLVLLHKAQPEELVGGGPTPEGDIEAGGSAAEQMDGNELQRGVIRYSRLLQRDAHEWLDNPNNDFMNFYKSKQRGIVKLTCVVCMYAETPDLLERSLRGLAHGIHQLATESPFLRSWDEAVVVIISDGLEKLHPDTAAWLEMKGVYSRALIDDAAKLDEALEGQKLEVALHCFEGLLQFEDWCPIQTMCVIKHNNAGKLDSQRWAFTGICERLMPVMPERLRKPAEHDQQKFDLDELTFNDLRALDRYLVTVDAGTQPLANSLRELLVPMRYDPTIAGTCGHMIPDKSVGNMMEMAQVFEYEHGHIVDKSMESMFGFISVLPGAYSAFRYDAIRRDQWVQGRYQKLGPLVGYFEPLVQAVDSPALLNMGLAEDRFLCFSLMTVKQAEYSLWYCRRAQAVTDVPDTLQAFLQQRRRWNNGAFFTRIYTIQHYLEIFQGTGHSFMKRLGFMILLAITVVDAVFVWFAAAFFYLWITYNVVRLGEDAANAFSPCFLIMYLLAVVAHYDRTVAEIKWVHMIIAFTLALEITFCMSTFFYDQITNPDTYVIVVVSISIASTFFCSLIQGKFFKMLMLFVPYLLMYPTYAILTQLYGFCHVHDVSWGTKGIDKAHGSAESAEKEKAVRRALSTFRFRILVAFILSNFIFGYVIDYFMSQYNILLWMLLIIVGFNVIRYLGSVAFTVVGWLDDALQLTALHGGIGRNFGPEYYAMRMQLQRINQGDMSVAKEVYFRIRKRAHQNQLQRQQETLKQVSLKPAPVQLSGLYFENGRPVESEEEVDPDEGKSQASAGPFITRLSGSAAAAGSGPATPAPQPSSPKHLPPVLKQTRSLGSKAGHPKRAARLGPLKGPFSGMDVAAGPLRESSQENFDYSAHISELPRHSAEATREGADQDLEATRDNGRSAPVSPSSGGASQPYFFAEMAFTQTWQRPPSAETRDDPNSLPGRM